MAEKRYQNPREWSEETSALAQSINEGIAYLRVLHAVPKKLTIGMVVYADGTDWDPGAGEGVYAYTSGGWVQL